jgi:ABC-type branched-subunit amino acid transport system substrate-binding protein
MPFHVLSGIANIFAGIWWHKDLPYPQVEAFVQEHKKKYQREPDSYYPSTAYDSVRILAAAIESAGPWIARRSAMGCARCD